jgi:hypothetical protein
VTFAYIGCAIDAGGWALLMPVVHMHCLHVSSVAGSLRSLNCGNATGLCSGVCLETLANPGNHGASVVLLDRIEHFAPLVRIQNCFFSTHSFLPSRTLVPQLRVGKRFLYWPVTRYAQSTKSPEINLTAREVDWAWWSQGAAR